MHVRASVNVSAYVSDMYIYVYHMYLTSTHV